ncbi:MAG: hypothetical protein JWP12_2716 [Bacteroidetes bacterium]|nr:hypothetical protein [Bacteroidota bacterium]
MKTNYTLKSLVVATFFAGLALNVNAQAVSESFNDITTLAGSGWVMTNASVAVGTTNWFQGTSVAGGGPFDSYNGAANAYIGANYNNTGNTGTISNWLMMPNRTLRNGDVITFYTRKVSPDNYADRLEVRMSTNGASTSVGTGTAVGDYTTLLLSVNPTLVLGVYPVNWTLYTITISGLPAPTSGRVAFRYFVTGGGYLGTASDYIGIDQVDYTPYVCPTVNVTPSSVTGGTAGTAYSSTLSQTGALGAPSFAVTAGALPPGLTLSASGTISGTPTATGTFNFTASVSDASGCVGSTAYSLTIVCPINGAALTTPPALCTNGTPYTLVEGSPAGGTYSGTNVSGGMFDPSSGSQSITYTLIDPYGCTQTANGIVTVNIPPAVGASSDAAANTICNGASVTLTGSGADTYVWDNSVTDGVAFMPTDTTVYTVTGTATSTGCSSTETITVNVNGLPTVTASSNAPANTVCEGSLVTLTGGGADTYTWDNSVMDGVAFSVADTTMYMVMGTTTATGCSNMAMITVYTNPLPAVTATSDAPLNTVCAGSSVTLNGVGADNYAWDNSVVDGVAFTVSATADYIVTGTSIATGCSANDTITITVNPLPAVDFPAFAGLVCDYSPVLTLSGGSPAGGTFSGTSVTAGSFDPTIGAGMYLITYSYTDANGCANSDTSSITVDVCTGIAANSNVENVMVYPNPSNGAFTVEFNQAVAGKVSVKITDLQGKLIADEELSNFAGNYKNNFDLSSFNKGMYLLEVTGNNTHFVSKVILK